MDKVLNAAGGLALFLLAMMMMTEGLQLFGGDRLRRLLERWTSSPAVSALTGTLITTLVQSSSAVTVATIGFVNAGMLSLPQALGLVFGANVGTTATGWLVSLVGVGLPIESAYLPVLAAGVVLRLASPEKRYQGLGIALAGFGLFFLGVSILQDALAGTAENFRLVSSGNGLNGLSALAFAGGGFLLTVLTQSSSASVAIILTAASQSLVGLNLAAAAIIGANLGTTSTAVLAAVGATPNARRVAAGHVAFNLITGAVGLLLLPLLLDAVTALAAYAGIMAHPAPVLALFHTTFNLLGVAIMLPFSGRLAEYLQGWFRTAEEDLSRPQYLDRTISGTPALALSALLRELTRLRGLVCALTVLAMDAAGGRQGQLTRRAEAIYQLGKTIDAFATTVRMANMPRESAEMLPRVLRIGRYLEEAARLTPHLSRLQRERSRLGRTPLRGLIDDSLAAARRCVDNFARENDADRDRESVNADVQVFEQAYQACKAGLLDAAAAGELPAGQVDSLLTALSHGRRLVEQIWKADGMLRHSGPERPAAEGPTADPADRAA